MTKFITIAGKKQSGKDTLACMMADTLRNEGNEVSIVGFADPLKRMCHDVFGIPLEWMYGSDEDKERLTDVMWDNLAWSIRIQYHTAYHDARDLRGVLVKAPSPRTGPMTVREVLQVIGTDIFRECIWDDVWAAAPFNKEHDTDFVIIPDCRFKNELLFARKNGITVRLKRDTGLVDTHRSEIALDEVSDSEFDNVYTNNGSLEELACFADAVLC